PPAAGAAWTSPRIPTSPPLSAHTRPAARPRTPRGRGRPPPSPPPSSCPPPPPGAPRRGPRGSGAAPPLPPTLHAAARASGTDRFLRGLHSGRPSHRRHGPSPGRPDDSRRAERAQERASRGVRARAVRTTGHGNGVRTRGPRARHVRDEALAGGAALHLPHVPRGVPDVGPPRGTLAVAGATDRAGRAARGLASARPLHLGDARAGQRGRPGGAHHPQAQTNTHLP